MVWLYQYLKSVKSRLCPLNEPLAGNIGVFVSLLRRIHRQLLGLPCRHRGFRAQRFYLNLLPVLGFLHHSTDFGEPDKPVTSVFLISQHRKRYKPSKNGAICASACLLCAQRFYLSAVLDRTFVQALIVLCIADRSGTKVLCANFIANSILHRAQRFYQHR